MGSLGREGDLFSRLRSFVQVTQFPHQYLALPNAKEKVAAVGTRKCPRVLLTRGRGGDVDVVPVEVVLRKMIDDFCQGLDSLIVGDLVHQSFHHAYLAVCRRDAGLYETLFADDLEMQFVTDAVRQLADELTLGATVSLPERMNPVDLGEEQGQFAGEISSWQTFEKAILSQDFEHGRQFLFD